MHTYLMDIMYAYIFYGYIVHINQIGQNAMHCRVCSYIHVCMYLKVVWSCESHDQWSSNRVKMDSGYQIE